MRTAGSPRSSASLRSSALANSSGDEEMQQAYRSGDFYLSFAKTARAVPPDATKKSHAAQREQLKTVSLGVLYGLSGEGLALKLGLFPGGELADLRALEGDATALHLIAALVGVDAVAAVAGVGVVGVGGELKQDT
jgi:hypothetical protein